MSFELRVTTVDDRRAAIDTFHAALLFSPVSDADWDKPGSQASWDGCHSISAWEGTRCIGHAAAFDFTTAVPGGQRVAMAGVTRVGVQQTHRRRGALTAAMRRLLLDAREQGKVLAGLRASEATIYGRFGFAVAGEAYDVEIDLRRGNRVVAPVADGSLRQLARDETLATVMALHERVGFDRPGTVGRSEWLHRRYLADALATDKPAYVIVHSAPAGADDGYAVVSLEWPSAFGKNLGGVCTVTEMWAATPLVELALWKYVLELDLVDTVRAEQRPGDDPLRFALADQRAYATVCRMDEQWLRLLDVDAALGARTFNAAQAAVTVAVTDPLLPHNTGAWQITADGSRRLTDGATSGADLVTTINGLSAAYLGGISWHELWVAGHVERRRPGAIADADVLFASRPLPRCGTFY